LAAHVSDNQQLSALTELKTADAMSWGSSDLDRLVNSCCHLQTLSLCCSPGLQLTALSQLSALTSLWIRGATEDSTVTSLVQLSALQGLQDLFVTDPCSFTNDDCVKSLTALTQLTRLGLPDSDGVFSTAMQQQLVQQIGQEVAAGADGTCHVVKNTVGTFCFGCVIDTAVTAAMAGTLLLCFHISACVCCRHVHALTGAPPNVWSQLLSCCEGCAQATQQQEAALDAALEQQVRDVLQCMAGEKCRQASLQQYSGDGTV